MYSEFQNCVSIVSIVIFDIIVKQMNYLLNPYVSSMTIDVQLHTKYTVPNIDKITCFELRKFLVTPLKIW